MATKASSESTGAVSSRIIAAEELSSVGSFSLGNLAITSRPAVQRLTQRDLTNETARAAYDLGRRRGFELGARSGLEQGYSEGSQALDEFQSRKATDVAGQMAALIDCFVAEMAALESQVASDLVSLAIDISRQVIRREISLSEDALIPVAKEALKALSEGVTQMEIRVHPGDADALGKVMESQSSALNWKLREDSGMTRGGCRIDADTGVADASFEARWQSVMSALGRHEEPLP